MNWTIIIIATAILLVIAIIIGVTLALGAKYLAVKEDTRVSDVTNMLPGLNCGGCGSAGCHQFAEKLVSGEVQVSGCRPSKPEVKTAIEAYLKEHQQKS
ncbi:MAG: (Fe-S)-binding protein [Bacilli bacterium]|nr:(Fe-S)-binding protein [Bacilli bacterium]MDD4066264.1 (Fe-S)-binding protein [Bacilli bacterium]